MTDSYPPFSASYVRPTLPKAASLWGTSRRWWSGRHEVVVSLGPRSALETDAGKGKLGWWLEKLPVIRGVLFEKNIVVFFELVETWVEKTTSSSVLRLMRSFSFYMLFAYSSPKQLVGWRMWIIFFEATPWGSATNHFGCLWFAHDTKKLG